MAAPSCGGEGGGDRAQERRPDMVRDAASSVRWAGREASRACWRRGAGRPGTALPAGCQQAASAAAAHLLLDGPQVSVIEPLHRLARVGGRPADVVACGGGASSVGRAGEMLRARDCMHACMQPASPASMRPAASSLSPNPHRRSPPSPAARAARESAPAPPPAGGCAPRSWCPPAASSGRRPWRQSGRPRLRDEGVAGGEAGRLKQL